MSVRPDNLDYGELTAAIHAVRIASRVTRRLQKELTGDFLTKGDRSPVTVADYAAQALISLALPANERIVGEESTSELSSSAGQEQLERVAAAVRSEAPGVTVDQVRSAIDRCSAGGGARGRFWVLDPIDGTKGFLRGQQYAIALGLMADGEVIGGVLGCPNLDSASGRGCLFAAHRDGGAWELPLSSSAAEPRMIRVSAVAEGSRAAFCESAEAMHSDHDRHARIAASLGVTASPVRMDSQCKYGAIARGDASIYLRLPTSATYREKIWDHAAGFAVVAAAGGRVTDAYGRNLDFSLGRTLDGNRGVIVTNRLLHDEVIAAAAALLPPVPAA